MYLGNEVAIKVYNVDLLDEIEKKHFVSEINLLISLRHPNLVSFIGFYMNKNKFSIVTEFMKQKSLKNVLDNKKINLKESTLINFCIDSTCAIWYMHSREPSVLHRDIKSSNILVDEHFKAKICDFGISKVFNFKKRKTETKSNTFWMAPESLLENIYTEKSDIFSLGILFWEIVHRDTMPYKNFNETCFYFKENLETIRPEIDKKINSKMVELIKQCWDFEPIKRPSIESIFNKLINIRDEIKMKESIRPPNRNTKQRSLKNVSSNSIMNINLNLSYPNSHNMNTLNNINNSFNNSINNNSICSFSIGNINLVNINNVNNLSNTINSNYSKEDENYIVSYRKSTINSDCTKN